MLPCPSRASWGFWVVVVADNNSRNRQKPLQVVTDLGEGIDGEYRLDRALVHRYPRHLTEHGVENYRGVACSRLKNCYFRLSGHFYTKMPATLPPQRGGARTAGSRPRSGGGHQDPEESLARDGGA